MKVETFSDKKILTLEFELIEWIDQFYNEGPMPLEDVLSYEVTGRTVGILVKETDEYVALSAEYFAHADNYRHIITIPKVCIKNRIKLYEIEQSND